MRKVKLALMLLVLAIGGSTLLYGCSRPACCKGFPGICITC